ncbi:molybdenum ABC transporter, periplasmic molybdate-binding protein [Halobacteroides halobius DSM 5150]|uniref:Molybdenum ABC transporter, periplasmic molybdate-binding protein n=1 Tax=Halobacteroides halobius (strain ATCC 35273 / DSM 5150 / MD-1) TaxID=748449 RepID=L0KAR9_HALHC|nr:molybdate ABC transporter substrate-binding protein [Halobacteroides halobius]AGB41188.1 molybdenum ABC transporter, periplasmic molybdate-binding protein [Halobacteroides halobius DSM 5150]
MNKLAICCLILMVVVTGCSYINSTAEKKNIRIMAAASLTEVFNDLKAGFESKHHDIKLEINYAGSQALYSQIKSGVTADLFASANIKYMNQLDEADMVVDPTIFAHNKLVIAVFKETENIINGIEDLVQKGVELVIADKSVPVGGYTIQMLNKQVNNPKLSSDYKEKFLDAVISKELDVKSVVAKVELGAADAGVVYKTDVNASNLEKVKVVNIKDKYNVIATYPIALLKGHKKGAKKFLNYLYSKEGGRILEKHGFIKESRE